MTTAKKLAQIAAWKKAHPDKVAQYQRNGRARRNRKRKSEVRVDQREWKMTHSEMMRAANARHYRNRKLRVIEAIRRVLA